MKTELNKNLGNPLKILLTALFFLIICSLPNETTLGKEKHKIVIKDDKPEITVGGNLEDFVFTPNINHILLFKTNYPASTNISFTISDYLNNLIYTKTVNVNNGAFTISVNLPAGYYQINFPSTGKSFGCFSIASFKGNRDPFFSVDAALSGLEPNEQIRQQFIDILQRAGISEVRERFTAALQKDYNTRQMYQNANISVSELILHNFESENMDSVSNNWAGIYKNYKNTWGSVEINNEPDLKSLPGDQYVTYIKTASYLFNNLGVKKPIVGGVFASAPDTYHDLCSYNGLLDNVDCISFHNYDKAILMQSTINRFRAWLEKSGKGFMPLWITESGMPGTSGVDRPFFKEETYSATEITMKAIEAKACGVSKYMAFVLDFYNEPPKSYGLVGKEKTPLRSLSSYLNCTNILSGYRYIGDLSNIDPQVKISRVFSSDDPNSPLIAVLYTGDVNPQASVNFKGTVQKIIGIDGRELHSEKSNSIPVPDGLTYIYLDKANANQLINSNTEVKKMLLLSQSTNNKPRENSPIVLQYLYKKSNVIPTTNRYFVTQANANSLLVTVRVHNLSENPIVANLSLKFENGKGFSPILNQNKTVTIQANQYVDVPWNLNLIKIANIGSVQLLQINCQSGTSIKQSLFLPFLVEGSLNDNLTSKTVNLKLKLNDLSKWHKNITQTGNAQFNAQNEDFVMNVNFSGLNSDWAYPKIDLPQIDDNSSGIIVRAKISNKAKTVALFIITKDNKTYWVNNFFPADGLWHVIYVDFNEFQPYNSNESNYSIKSNMVKQFMIGMQSLVQNNSIEVSDMELVAKK